MKCPVCGCQNFFVKDPDDEFEIYEFQFQDGIVEFGSEEDASLSPLVQDDTETFCDKCAWHGKLKELKKNSD